MTFIMAAFPGFPKEALGFLSKLKKNNNRDWFQANKHVYEEFVKAPTQDWVSAINQFLASASPGLVTDPKKSIYRFYRDTRFSKDKTPYKTHTAALFHHAALCKHGSAGLYAAVSPVGVEVAGGVYMPGPDELRILREWIAANHQEMEKLAGERRLTAKLGSLQGEQLARIPKGFPKDHPAESLLRRKQWYFYTTWDAALALTPKLMKEIELSFRLMLPFIDFMNSPLLADHKRKSVRREFERVLP